jgi:hypothetical protein
MDGVSKMSHCGWDPCQELREIQEEENRTGIPPFDQEAHKREMEEILKNMEKGGFPI